MATKFTAGNFLLRVTAAFVLVFATYNPLKPYSYYEWAIAPAIFDFSLFTPIQGLLGVMLLIGWVIFLRATARSLSLFGILLAVALIATSIWVMVDQGWVSLDGSGAITWVVLIGLSLVLAVGMSWSHIRRRMTGQLDVDEVDSE